MKKFLAALLLSCCMAFSAPAQNIITLPIAANAVADIGNGPIKVRVIAGNASIFSMQGSGIGGTSGLSNVLTLTGTPATAPLVGGLISGPGITSGTTVAAYNGTTGITLSSSMTVPGGSTVSWGAACPASAAGIPAQYIQASVMADYYLFYTQARVCAVSPGGPVNTLLILPVFYERTTPENLAGAQAPLLTRYEGIDVFFAIQPDPKAILLDIYIIAGGGGGTGNGASNIIPYSQYGAIGKPSAWGVTPQNVTISNGANNTFVTTAPHIGTQNALAVWEYNRPFYFSNNGDTLPAGLSFNTIYYLYAGVNGGSGTGAPTQTAFGVSATLYNSPLICSVYAPACQTVLTTTTAGSGTHVLNMFTFASTPGGGGGGVGDGGIPGVGIGCDQNGPAGYLQSASYTGGIGGNVYGVNIAPGTGGAGPFGAGGGANAGVGTELGGAGGSGAFPLATASGGGGGGGAGGCHIILKLTPKPSPDLIPVLCGSPGNGGPAAVQSVTFTNGSPTVMTATAANFPKWAAVTFTGGSLPTGVTAYNPVTNTPIYFVYPTDATGNTFNLYTVAYSAGSIVNTSSTGSGTVTTGTAGAAGGYGSCTFVQSYGAN